MGIVMSKISVTVLDKLLPSTTLAVTATVSGWESKVFSIFWSLLTLKKGHDVREVPSDYKAYEGALEMAIDFRLIPKLFDLLRYGENTSRMRVYTRLTRMGFLNMGREDLIDCVGDVVDVAPSLNGTKNLGMILYM